jgi:signal peptidase I
VVIDILETIVLSVLLFVAINAISARIRVDGFSMEPTLQSGEFVVVNKLAYKLGEPQVGDVIIFQYPRDPDQEYIKRVIGTPDDHVKIENGMVYVNGVLLNEPYIAAQPAYQNEWTIPDNTIFVNCALTGKRNRMKELPSMHDELSEGTSQQFYLCSECQTGVYRHQYCTYFTWLNQELITVPNFPAWVCDVAMSADDVNTISAPSTG